MKYSTFLELEAVELEFDVTANHVVYPSSHFFFAHIEHGTSVLVQFIPRIKDGTASPTFIDGARVRIGGEVYIVLDKRIGLLPVMEYESEPPFDPVMMQAYVHRVHSLSDVDAPFPNTLWATVPGMAYEIPKDDPQLRQVSHGRYIAATLKKQVEDINALMQEGSSESDLAGDIKDVQELISYNLRVMLKNVTREHIRGA